MVVYRDRLAFIILLGWGGMDRESVSFWVCLLGLPLSGLFFKRTTTTGLAPRFYQLHRPCGKLQSLIRKLRPQTVVSGAILAYTRLTLSPFCWEGDRMHWWEAPILLGVYRGPLSQSKPIPRSSFIRCFNGFIQRVIYKSNQAN